MMKHCHKIFALMITILLTSVLLTACGDRTAATPEDFTSIMEEQGLTVEDVTDQYNKANEATGIVLTSVLIARSEDGWQIEYYDAGEASVARRMYAYSQELFEDAGGSGMNTSLSMGNYSIYTQSAGGVYSAVSCIGTTLVYVNEDIEYKEPIQTAFKELGYK